MRFFGRELISDEAFKRLAVVAVVGFLVFAVLWKGGKSLESTWLLMGLAWLTTVQYWSGEPKRALHLPLWLWTCLLVYVLWTVQAFLQSQTGNYGLDEVLRTAALVFVFCWIGRTIIEERNTNQVLGTRELVLLWLVYSTIVACFVGVLVYVFQPVSRFVGTFFDPRFHTDYWPNAWAEYLLLAWPIVVWWLWNQGARSKYQVTKKNPSYLSLVTCHQKLFGKNLTRIITLGFVIGCLFLSFSRGGFIAFLGQSALWLAILVMIKTPSDQLKQFALQALGVLVVALVTFYGLTEMRSRFYVTESVEQKMTFSAAEGTSSISERQQFWQHALQLTHDRPFFGWGPYSFRFVHTRLQEHVLATSDHPHNVWLKLAMERGVIAAVLFTVIVGAVWLISFFVCWQSLEKKEANKRRNQQTWQLPVLIAVIGVLAHSLIDYNLQFVGMALPFWLLLGMLSTELYTKKGDPRNDKIYRVVEVCVLTVLIVVALVEGKQMVFSSFGRHAEARGEVTEALNWYKLASGQKFSRDMHLSRTKLLLSSEKPDKAYDMLGNYFHQNAVDARAWKLNGDVCLTQRDIVCAIDSYEKAFAYNRYNDMSVVYTFADLQYSMGARKGIDENRRMYEELMNDFALAIEQNAHFVALSPNVEALIAMTELFARMYPDDEPQYAVLGAKMERKAREAREKVKARPPGYLW